MRETPHPLPPPKGGASTRGRALRNWRVPRGTPQSLRRQLPIKTGSRGNKVAARRAAIGFVACGRDGGTGRCGHRPLRVRFLGGAVADGGAGGFRTRPYGGLGDSSIIGVGEGP